MRILHNAKIYTLNPNQPTASAVAIDDHAPPGGRILAVGNDEEIIDAFGFRAELEDVGGQVVLPGLTDSHIHLRYYGLSLSKVDCSTPTKDQCLQNVADRAKQTPSGQWIQGHGWNQNDWQTGFGNASELDAVAPNHPVYLTATSLHAAWANTAALTLAGINKSTPDPQNGLIERDSNGEATGILFEQAMKLVSEKIPEPSARENENAILNAQTELWKMGLTGVHDFDRKRSFEALQALHANGELKLRVLKHIPVERLEYALGVGLHSGFGDDMLRIGSMKMFADGALGPRTAAMLDPYEGEPENLGMLFVDREEILEQAQQAAKGGLSMTVHAIGDRANHEVLAAYEQLRQFEQSENITPGRHRLEHAQILHPKDFDKFKALDIIASVQPIHATSDMEMADKYWGERSKYSYAWKTLLESRVKLSFGSDAPVDSPNPFWGIHAAVTRQRRDGTPGNKGWYPEQRLTVEEALHAYTLGAAYATGMENRLGMLAPGYLADLIIIPQDPFNSPPKKLWDINPVATMVGGDWVWRN
ncbi:MAG: amidohydrolase [Chloroflexota bacterium]